MNFKWLVWGRLSLCSSRGLPVVNWESAKRLMMDLPKVCDQLVSGRPEFFWGLYFFFSLFPFFVLDFFYSKLGSKRIVEKTTLQSPLSVFGATPESFPNIASIGNASQLHSIAICFAAACANALPPDFSPFCPSPPSAESSLLFSFFTLAFYPVSFSHFCRSHPHPSPLFLQGRHHRPSIYASASLLAALLRQTYLNWGVWRGEGCANPPEKAERGCRSRENGGDWVIVRDQGPGWMDRLISGWL